MWSGEVTMAVNPDPSATRRGWQAVYYRGPSIVVTSRYIQTASGRYLVRDLNRIERAQVFTHPARMVALICGVIELALAALFATAYGSAALLCTGLVAGAGLALAILVDDRRNPRWMALRAVHDGQPITLFQSRDRQEFEQVRRAVIRAVEDNRPLRP
jgi:hypothetical protein